VRPDDGRWWTVPRVTPPTPRQPSEAPPKKGGVSFSGGRGVLCSVKQSGEIMNADEQAKWDNWAQSHIKIALKQEREVVACALGDVMKQFDVDIAKLRKEVRDA
jgi:hypothetical protein